MMKICKYVVGLLAIVVLLSCGGSGKNRKREPSRKSKRKIEVVEKKKSSDEVDENVSGEASRNNGNYRKAKQSRRNNARSVERSEEETIRDSKPNAARIDKRVKLEQQLWEANENGNNAKYEQLREEIIELTKKMSQQEIDEASKKIKDIKKRMYFEVNPKS